MTSRYLEAFQKLQASNNVEFIGDLLVVEKLSIPQARSVGDLLVQDSDHARSAFSEATRPHLALVVAVGEGYYSDDKDVALNTKPGDIVLVPPQSIKYFSAFGALANYQPDTLGITRDGEVQMRFRGAEAYEQAFDILNKYAKDTTSV